MRLVSNTMPSDTTIRDFWLSNPQYWIAIGPMQLKADTEIWGRFSEFDISTSDTFGKVVYLDQFLRHFSRVQPEVWNGDAIRRGRVEAAATVAELDLNGVSEAELVWYLMPWKHLEIWDKLFATLFAFIGSAKLTDYTLLNRFFMDSYVKAYNAERVSSAVETFEPDDWSEEAYDPAAICESYPEDYTRLSVEAWLNLPLPEEAGRLLLPVKQDAAISLSGGVDSMLMAALLSRTSLSKPVAIHIVYGNRVQSLEELAFIKRYCAKLSIRLYVYTIEWLRRDCVDRAFYEKVTRSIRFSVYKAVGRPVLLGHIQEDIVENIWTNFAKGTHLVDLAKLGPEAWEDGVQVLRPWLHVQKSTVYAAAVKLAIPHLKNTTPSWSNRGKFRSGFYAATHMQYGDSVDAKIVEVAGRLKHQSLMLDKILFQPMLTSWDDERKQLNVTQGVNVELDGDGWLHIFSTICHGSLGVGKPSFAACNEFSERIKRGLVNGMKINMRKDLQFVVVKKGDETWLQRVN